LEAKRIILGVDGAQLHFDLIRMFVNVYNFIDQLKQILKEEEVEGDQQT
jgi:hypothetical protein